MGIIQTEKPEYRVSISMIWIRVKLIFQSLSFLVFFAAGTSLVFLVQESEAGHHPHLHENNFFAGDLYQPEMGLDRQLKLVLPLMNFPELDTENLNFLSTVAELHTSELLKISSRDFPDDFPYLKVKALIFVQLLQISLLSSSSHIDWLYETPLSPQLFNDRSWAASYLSPTSSPTWTMSNKWESLGQAVIIDGGNFVWRPRTLLDKAPLSQAIMNTLLMAFQIEPQMSLFGRVSVPIFQQTHSGQALLSELAAEILLYQILKYDFVWKTISREFSEGGPLSHSESIVFEELKNARSFGQAFEYLESILKWNIPRLSLLSHQSMEQINRWILTKKKEGMSLSQIQINLASYENALALKFRDIDPFSLRKVARKRKVENRFLDYWFIKVSEHKKYSCRKTLR